MSEFITIGEPVVTFASTDKDANLSDATHYTKILGGAELNVAIGIERLGHSTEYISQVGTDPLGKYAKSIILKHGVGIKYINNDDNHWTGHQLKQLVTKGDPETYNYRKNSAASHISSKMISEIDLKDTKIAHLTGIFPAISNEAKDAYVNLIKKLEKNNIMITFDTNLRPSLWKNKAEMIETINELAKHGDIVMPGINEGKVLMGSDIPSEIADFYLNNSNKTKVVLVKLGADGVYVKTKAGDSYNVKGFKVSKVVDTVGAGDGFALGVISALLENKDLKSAVIRGNAVGALQVQTPGDNDGYPTKLELQKFYSRNGIINTNIGRI